MYRIEPRVASSCLNLSWCDINNYLLCNIGPLVSWYPPPTPTATNITSLKLYFGVKSRVEFYQISLWSHSNNDWLFTLYHFSNSWIINSLLNWSKSKFQLAGTVVFCAQMFYGGVGRQCLVLVRTLITAGEIFITCYHPPASVHQCIRGDQQTRTVICARSWARPCQPIFPTIRINILYPNDSQIFHLDTKRVQL